MNKNIKSYISLIDRVKFIIKSTLIIIFVNRLTSIFRNAIKKIISGNIVRFFDDFRQSKNEREFKGNKIIVGVNRELKDADNIYEDIKNIIFDFVQLKSRPSDDDIKKILIKSNNTSLCLDIYYAFFVNGLMSHSLCFRDKARDILVQELKDNPIKLGENINQKVAAAFENGWDVDELNQILGCLPNNVILKNKFGIKMQSKILSYGEKLNYCKFNNLISDKKIAIIGPAKISVDLLKNDLKNYDILILTNVLSNNDILKSLRDLNITTISYYNGYNAKRIFHDPSLNPDNDVDFAVYIDVKYSFQLNQVFRKKARIFKKNPYIISGAHQAFQSILYDLSRFSPKCVKAFGFTFYASENPYRKGYSTPLNRILYDLTRHDPIGNFIFAKNLYKMGFFEGDTAVEKIINMSNTEYLNALECAFHVNG